MSYFVDLFGEKTHRLDLLITFPQVSARLADGAGPPRNGATIHLLQADKEHEAMRFIVLSIDLLEKKHWGPYSCGNCWALMLEGYEVSDLIHIRGFQKVVMGDKNLTDKRFGQTNRTNFISGLPFPEWEIVWDILNKVRSERIKNRMSKPRTERGQKFDDDILDIFVSRMMRRVNAILNSQLFWGLPDNIPGRGQYFLSFEPDQEAFEEKKQNCNCE